MMMICVLSMMMMIFDDDDDLSNLLCISVILISDVKLKNISSMAHLTIISYVRPMIISSLHFPTMLISLLLSICCSNMFEALFSAVSVVYLIVCMMVALIDHKPQF